MQIKVRTTLRGLCMKDGNQFSDKQILESMLLGFLDYRLYMLELKQRKEQVRLKRISGQNAIIIKASWKKYAQKWKEKWINKR